MPEGPEVKVTADWLRSEMVGESISVEILKDGAYSKFRDKLPNSMTVLDVDCKGKQLWFKLKVDEHTMYLTNHMMLTGKWSQTRGKSSRICFIYGEKKIWFNDVRGYAKFDILSPDEFDVKMSRIGPDILNDLDESTFLARMTLKSAQNKSIAVALATPAIISGIGNYLRADILYDAQVDPRTKTKDLSIGDLKKIYVSARKITQDSYSKGGSKKYTGKYEPLVYGRKTDSEGRKVETFKLSGRIIYWVPIV